MNCGQVADSYTQGIVEELYKAGLLKQKNLKTRGKNTTVDALQPPPPFLPLSSATCNKSVDPQSKQQTTFDHGATKEFEPSSSKNGSKAEEPQRKNQGGSQFKGRSIEEQQGGRPPKFQQVKKSSNTKKKDKPVARLHNARMQHYRVKKTMSAGIPPEQQQTAARPSVHKDVELKGQSSIEAPACDISRQVSAPQILMRQADVIPSPLIRAKSKHTETSTAASKSTPKTFRQRKREYAKAKAKIFKEQGSSNSAPRSDPIRERKARRQQLRERDGENAESSKLSRRSKPPDMPLYIPKARLNSQRFNNNP